MRMLNWRRSRHSWTWMSLRWWNRGWIAAGRSGEAMGILLGVVRTTMNAKVPLALIEGLAEVSEEMASLDDESVEVLARAVEVLDELIERLTERES